MYRPRGGDTEQVLPSLKSPQAVPQDHHVSNMLETWFGHPEEQTWIPTWLRQGKKIVEVSNATSRLSHIKTTDVEQTLLVLWCSGFCFFLTCWCRNLTQWGDCLQGRTKLTHPLTWRNILVEDPEQTCIAFFSWAGREDMFLIYALVVWSFYTHSSMGDRQWLHWVDGSHMALTWIRPLGSR